MKDHLSTRAHTVPSRQSRALLLLLCLVSLIVVSCGDDGAASDRGGGASSEPAQPVNGGTLRFGQYAPINSLDPIAIPGAVLGENEGLAVYDALMRYDEDSDSFVVQLAESLTPNPDFSAWTLKLRANVMFSDGTPLDADSVVANLERHRDPAKSFYTTSLMAQIASVEVVDPSTVSFTLNDSYPRFPYVLSVAPGMIAAPSFLAKVDAGDASATPIGAGPFTVDTFRPNEILSLVRNPSYWGDAPHLDGVDFVFVPGGVPTVQAFQNGELDAAFLYDASARSKAKSDGIAMHDEHLSLAGVILMNNASSSVLRDVRLREAVAKAIDPDVLDERLNQGAGDPGSRLFHEASRWYVESDAGVPFDPERAKSLVEQVKRETGWDGTIRLLCHNSPDNVNFPVAVKSMLEPVGFKVVTKNDIDVSTMVADVFVKRDFDLSCWGVAVVDSNPFHSLDDQLNSTAEGTNMIGFADPEMDASLVQLRAAKNADEMQAALSKLSGVWSRTYPLVNYASGAFSIVHADDVHGLRYTVYGGVLLDKAWISK